MILEIGILKFGRNITFTLRRDEFTRIFKLSPSLLPDNEMELEKESKEITSWSLYQTIFHDNLLVIEEFPICINPLKEWVIAFVTMIKIVLGDSDFDKVTKENLYLFCQSNRNGPIQIYDWAAFICNKIQEEMSNLKLAIEQDHNMMPHFSFDSIFMHFMMGRMDNEMIYLLGGEKLEIIQERLAMIQLSSMLGLWEYKVLQRYLACNECFSAWRVYTTDK